MFSAKAFAMWLDAQHEYEPDVETVECKLVVLPPNEIGACDFQVVEADKVEPGIVAYDSYVEMVESDPRTIPPLRKWYEDEDAEYMDMGREDFLGDFLEQKVGRRYL